VLDSKKATLEAFRLWDSNGDGQVDIRDILQTLKSHGEDMTMEEAKEILAECDVDKDGVINFRDFAAAIERPSFDALDA
jgi:Ca2+-binding EF-hand superfamily protein